MGTLRKRVSCQAFFWSATVVFVIVGMFLVIAAVLGGFLMERGPLLVLMQPAELIIIGGAAAGTLLVANPMRLLKEIAARAAGVFGKSHYSREAYLAAFKMMYELLSKARRAGMLSIEADIEAPAESPIFQANPEFLKQKHICDFVCDTLRLAVSNNAESFAVDQMLELDMEVRHHGATESAGALSAMADSLPGLGIVAAVLGVVITMSALGGPPEAIGHKVAAALVGTFLGILLCYGFIGPFGSHMTKIAEEERDYLYALRVLMIAAIKGDPPIIAIEMGRRAIPLHERPSFVEVEAACRGEAAAAPSEGVLVEPAQIA
jgi:chemotaxis protein MotA